MKVRRTYKYRMYDSKQNKHLDEALSLAAEIWNHCIALHRRYYRAYGKHLNAYKLQAHITKLKKLQSISIGMPSVVRRFRILLGALISPTRPSLPISAKSGAAGSLRLNSKRGRIILLSL